MPDLREKVFGFLNKLTSECDELLTSAQEICTWVEDENGDWHTDCTNMFAITEGSPMDNDFKYCLYCGRPIVAAEFRYEDDEDD